MRVLITGGAGFIGSSLAVALTRRHPDWELIAADNLYRRGSELNLPRLRANGVRFEHADVRHHDDLDRLGPLDAIVEAAAEPAVGADRRAGGRSLLVATNLLGACNCLEVAARHGSHFIALSTSRVYPLNALAALAYEETDTRFELSENQPLSGASAEGVSERFPLAGPRSLYGATKLAGEVMALDYGAAHGFAVTVNRCGVVSGPWQMGSSEQGVFAHWALSFQRGRSLSYIGYGGTGKQVRDLLHVDDFSDLIDLQLCAPSEWDGVTVNVGGGRQGSLSLLEASRVCAELSGREVEVRSVPQTRPGDVPVYISDCSLLFARTDWRPRRPPREILADIFTWAGENELALEAI